MFRMFGEYIDKWHIQINNNNGRVGSGGNKLRTYGRAAVEISANVRAGSGGNKLRTNGRAAVVISCERTGRQRWK